MNYVEATKKRGISRISILLTTAVLLIASICSTAADSTAPEITQSGNVSIDLVSAPLSDAIKELTQQTNIPFSMDSWAADRPFTLLCHNTPYKQLLPAIA